MGQKNGVCQINGRNEDEELSWDQGNEAEPPNDICSNLRSEDIGLDVSASTQQHISPEMGLTAEEKEMSNESERLWRRGGSIDTLTQSLQDILAFIATRLKKKTEPL